eukprot:8713669-Pyramimonas_sp.AAC.1
MWNSVKSGRGVKAKDAVRTRITSRVVLTASGNVPPQFDPPSSRFRPPIPFAFNTGCPEDTVAHPLYCFFRPRSCLTALWPGSGLWTSKSKEPFWLDFCKTLDIFKAVELWILEPRTFLSLKPQNLSPSGPDM